MTGKLLAKRNYPDRSNLRRLVADQRRLNRAAKEQLRDPRLADSSWRQRVGFDNIMSATELRAAKWRDANVARRGSLGLSA